MINEKELDQLVVYVTNEAFQGMDYCNPLDIEIAIRDWFRLHQADRLNPEESFDDYLKDPGKYFRKMEDNLINEILCDSQNCDNK